MKNWALLDAVGRVGNVASFADDTTPDALFGATAYVPYDMPVGIGDFWDGEAFRRGAPDGPVVEPAPDLPEPEPGYDELADLLLANDILMGGAVE